MTGAPRSPGPGPLDKREARRAFARAAHRYDEVAVLQREIGQRMLERLDLVHLTPEWILDVGSGTGVATAALSKRYRRARVIALDFALPMLHATRRRGPWLRKPRCICADAEHLPLADMSVDLIYSNATLQWCNDLEHTFREFLRVLRPGGLLMFSTFGPDTLKELRASWSQADAFAHVSPFLDMHDIGDALVRAHWAEPVMDVDRITLTYQDVHTLMRDLKVLGAHNVLAQRHRGLTGKGRLRRMQQAYEAFRQDGRLPASYEVIYGHAWAPAQRPIGDAVGIPVSQIGRHP